MDILFEQRIIQNESLAAETIWYAVNETHSIKKCIEGVSFPLSFLILPLTFHQRTAQSLSSRTQPGSIYKAIADDKEITVGLQMRMEALYEKTCNALSLAFHSDLLLLDPGNYQLIPGRKTPPINHISDEVKIILNAAKRVGQTFAELSAIQIIHHLGVTF